MIRFYVCVIQSLNIYQHRPTFCTENQVSWDTIYGSFSMLPDLWLAILRQKCTNSAKCTSLQKLL